MAQGIGAYIMERQADGVHDRDILREVLDRFPGARTTIESVRWYRSKSNKALGGGRTREHREAAPESRRPVANLPDSIPASMFVDGVELRPGQHGFYYVDGVRTFRPQGGMGLPRGGRRGRGFNATLYAGGAKVAEAVDPGTGARPTYHFLDEGAQVERTRYPDWDGAPIDEEVTPLHAHWLRHVAGLPKAMDQEHTGQTVHVSPERHLARLVDDALVERRLRGEMQGHVLFMAGGQLMRLPVDGSTPARVKRSVERNYPGALILNEMPMADAIKLVP
jgi:hypothetical protein